VTALYLPFGHAESIAYTHGRVWATGYVEPNDASLFQLDPSTLESLGPSPLTPQLGSRANIVATYGNRVLIRSSPGGTSLYCMNATTGAFKQKWTEPLGAVTLNQRGLLITSHAGIEQVNARDCLAG
jgi:hypothetical protein